MSVIPVLAGGGTVFLDRRAHKTIYDGCAIARRPGARPSSASPTRTSTSSSALLERTTGARPGLICIDGVNSMTGNAPDLKAFAALAREHDALLYVDDAHGFGVIGERSDRSPAPTASAATASSAISARATTTSSSSAASPRRTRRCWRSSPARRRSSGCSRRRRRPYLYSGPSPVASLATALEGLRVNDVRGDALRAELSRLTGAVLDRVDELGITTPNHSGFPIIEIPLADPDSIDAVGDLLFDRGIYVTMAAYPLVPREEVGFRLQLTAANTDEQIDHLSVVLGEVAERFKLRDGSAE